MWFVGALVAGLGGGTLAQAADVVEYYHLDAIGNVRLITDKNGDVVERHDYYPFGEECTTGPCAANPGVGAGHLRKFTAKERDTETSFDYFGARYYGSKIGRFTTVDPKLNITTSLPNPQKWNRYAYGLNNPLRHVDPDGREEGGACSGAQDCLEVAEITLDLLIGTAEGVLTAVVPGMEIEANNEAQRVGQIGGQVVTTAGVLGSVLSGGPPRVTEAYRRPSGATTAEQRAMVQGQPCVKCGVDAPKMVAGHKKALVKEHYETGKINKQRMRDPKSIQPECPKCSAKEGAELSRYSVAKRKELGL